VGNLARQVTVSGFPLGRSELFTFQLCISSAGPFSSKDKHLEMYIRNVHNSHEFSVAVFFQFTTCLKGLSNENLHFGMIG
jgi:hypothetical protein